MEKICPELVKFIKIMICIAINNGFRLFSIKIHHAGYFPPSNCWSTANKKFGTRNGSPPKLGSKGGRSWLTPNFFR